MTEYWRLTIQGGNGNCASVFGTEDVLRHALEEWLEYANAENDTERESMRQVLTVEGYSDTFDRAPTSFSILKNEVISVGLLRIA